MSCLDSLSSIRWEIIRRQMELTDMGIEVMSCLVWVSDM